jgi:hypothetical protein
MRRTILRIGAVAAGLAFAAPAHADPDTDFTSELHTYGIYGQKDYNAGSAKITCGLNNGVDLVAPTDCTSVRRCASPNH